VTQAAAETEPMSRRDPIAWLIALLGLFVLCYWAWWASGLGDTALSNRFSNAATVPGGILMVLGAIRVGRSERLDPRTRRAWTIIGLAAVVYGVGALIRFGTSSVPGLSLLSPVAQVLEIAPYALVALGLATLPRPAQTMYDLVLFTLDVAIVAWSTAILVWHFVIFPAARIAGTDLATTLNAVSFPVLDLALVFATGAIVIRGVRASSQAALTVAAVALLVLFGGDMISGIEILKGNYTPVGLAGLLFSSAWFLLAVAAYIQ
jgi:hypothetical protein